MTDPVTAPAPTTDPTTTVKPGYKTTEFYLSLVATILSFLLASGFVGAGTTLDKVIGFGASVLTALGYTVSRAIVKSNS